MRRIPAYPRKARITASGSGSITGSSIRAGLSGRRPPVPDCAPFRRSTRSKQTTYWFERNLLILC